MKDAGATFFTTKEQLSDYRALKDAWGRPIAEIADSKLDGLFIDASKYSGANKLDDLRNEVQPLVTQVHAGGRITFVAPSPEQATNAELLAFRQGLTGFVKSLAKELGRKGIGVNLIYVDKGAEKRLAPVVTFLLSARSTFISAQVVTVSKTAKATDDKNGLEGKIALVTGAARGIGAAISAKLAQEGATVIGLDHPSAEDAINAQMASIGGQSLTVDLCAKNAAAKIEKEIASKYDGLDIIVHNAGVTRDRTFKKMSESEWQLVMDVNLRALIKVDKKLRANLLRKGGRIICLSSVTGFAGNAGQTNYGFTKAALIGYVKGVAEEEANDGITANAIAPGLIETKMTEAMPKVTREFARRLSALMQGGLPEDVANAVAFLASPNALGISGQTLRVCGGSLVG